jgi:hypothetical protein
MKAQARNNEQEQDDVDDFAFFRALPLAFGFGLLGWVALAAIAFGIYKLTH